MNQQCQKCGFFPESGESVAVHYCPGEDRWYDGPGEGTDIDDTQCHKWQLKRTSKEIYEVYKPNVDGKFYGRIHVNSVTNRIEATPPYKVAWVPCNSFSDAIQCLDRYSKTWRAYLFYLWQSLSNLISSKWRRIIDDDRKG